MPRKRRATTKAANKEDPLIGVLRAASAEKQLAKRSGKTGEECSFTDYGETATLETKSILIKTSEQALAKANIDTSLWEVDRQTVNSWEVAAFDKHARDFVVQPLWQVKLQLKRKVAKKYTDGIDWICDRFKTHRLKPLKPVNVVGSCLFEPCLYDAQIGRYAWGAETGQDVDVEKSTAVYENAIEDFASRLKGWPIAKIIMPLGHDLFEVDNWEQTTAAGTPQDVDTRFPRVFGLCYAAVERCVLRLRRIAPVELKYIPGNHDPATSFYLCFALKERFRDFVDVGIDIAPKSRKYVDWGVNLIGMTHGNHEKHRDLPTIMAAEVPDLWAKSKYREWHTGHYHTAKQTVHQTADEFGGVRVRVLPSIAGTNRYSFQKGFVGGRQSAEGYLWDQQDGYVGHFSVNARET